MGLQSTLLFLFLFKCLILDLLLPPVSAGVLLEKRSCFASPRCSRRDDTALFSSTDKSDVDRGPKTSHSQRSKRSTTRSTAVFALMQSMNQKAIFAIRKLENDRGYLSLDRRDRSFARLMLTTAERRHGQIEKVINEFVTKPGKKKKSSSDILCDATLRIGAAQLLFLGVPSYAVLQETVEVLRMHPKIQVAKSQIAFVNAMLRRIDKDGADALKSTSTFDNVEPGLVREWKNAYGDETARLIVEMAMDQSPIFVTVNHKDSHSKEEHSERIRAELSLINEAELLPTGSIRVPEQPTGSIPNWPLFAEGEWWVQDPSASLPAIVLQKEFERSGETDLSKLHVVDLCSAPGGKTAQLCSMGFGEVTAVELSEKRMKVLKENLKRLRMLDSCKIVVSDGRGWVPIPAGTVDGVLVDAPCSATGLGSRRPDVLHKSPDVKDLLQVQRELVAHAVDSILKPGGVMVYATCSLLKQESEDQMSWLMSREKGASVEPSPILPEEVPGFEKSIDENGWIRVVPGTLPGSHQFCDGFFVARLKRIG